jgi:membrane protease YdiL (CAAX protease family)
MRVSAELRRNRPEGLFSLVTCLLLLWGRVLLVGQGQLSIALLTTMYISIILMCRVGFTAGSPIRAVLPLLIGVVAVLSAWRLLAPPFTWSSTNRGVLISLLAAVAEEGLFRGLLFSRLQPYGKNRAVLGSAIAFALVHLPFYGVSALPIDFGAGVLFSWQRSDSGSWSVPAITHAIANMLAVMP